MLILSLMLCPFVAIAVDEMQGLHEQGEAKFMTVVKDVEVERLVGSEPEFNKCRDENKFEKLDKNKQAKITKATTCFKAFLGTKSEADLKKLASNLKLEEYGLTQSKNVNEITTYLSGKMHKALTGVSPTDKDFGKQKWEDKKIVDQKVFIELYKNQLVKNSLFEISRYCFENLRLLSAPAGTDFASYWSGVTLTLPADGKMTTTELAKLTDVGDANGGISFADKLSGADLKDDKVVYEKLISGLTPVGTPISTTVYKDFFPFCRATIKPLCEEFKKTSTSNVSAATSTSQISRGSSACLTYNKLESIRMTLRNTEKVAKQFDEMKDKNTFAIQMIKNPKFYGNDANDQSLDELTSTGSADFLKEADNDKLRDLETKCAGGSQADECQQFLKVDDGLDKAIYTIETEMTLKRELETERAKKLSGQSLKDYLKENRHFDLLEKFDTLTKADIELGIEQFYNAKRLAEIEALKFKVGKRQINTDEDKALGGGKDAQILENIKNSKEERARLAQVVMFNNIITSQLTLSRKSGNTTTELGSNVSGWTKESAGLNGISGIDETLFAGVQSSADSTGIKSKESIADIGFLDAILGVDTSKPADP